jgi:hypothetical protein
MSKIVSLQRRHAVGFPAHLSLLHQSGYPCAEGINYRLGTDSKKKKLQKSAKSPVLTKIKTGINLTGFRDEFKDFSA